MEAYNKLKIYKKGIWVISDRRSKANNIKDSFSYMITIGEAER